jgi:hypothetical protein
MEYVKMNCPECQGILHLTGIITLNNQVNFKCSNCDTYGFILDGIDYYQKKTPGEYANSGVNEEE